MKPFAIPPIVAGIVAAVIAVARRLSVVLFAQGNPPPVEAMTWYIQGGRFVSFVLAYGLLFGLAYWAGTRRSDPGDDVTLALASGAAGALGHLVGLGAVLLQIGLDAALQQGWLVGAVFPLATAVAAGVQLAVVVFAGVSLARRGSGAGSANRGAPDRSPATRSD